MQEACLLEMRAALGARFQPENVFGSDDGDATEDFQHLGRQPSRPVFH
jgi:hypothetical protein